MTFQEMPPDEASFNRAFCGRLRAARVGAGLTQEHVARSLGLSVSTWRKYETCRALPPYLIEDFAALTGIGIDDLFR